jgi:hypothetical protein
MRRVSFIVSSLIVEVLVLPPPGMISGMPGGISSAIRLGCDDEKGRVVVGFNTRINAR